jgi:hypothetical protein
MLIHENRQSALLPVAGRLSGPIIQISGLFRFAVLGLKTCSV